MFPLLRVLLESKHFIPISSCLPFISYHFSLPRLTWIDLFFNSFKSNVFVHWHYLKSGYLNLFLFLLINSISASLKDSYYFFQFITHYDFH